MHRGNKLKLQPKYSDRGGGIYRDVTLCSLILIPNVLVASVTFVCTAKDKKKLPCRIYSPTCSRGGGSPHFHSKIKEIWSQTTRRLIT